MPAFTIAHVAVSYLGSKAQFPFVGLPLNSHAPWLSKGLRKGQIIKTWAGTSRPAASMVSQHRFWGIVSLQIWGLSQRLPVGKGPKLKRKLLCQSGLPKDQLTLSFQMEVKELTDGSEHFGYDIRRRKSQDGPIWLSFVICMWSRFIPRPLGLPAWTRGRPQTGQALVTMIEPQFAPLTLEIGAGHMGFPLPSMSSKLK